MKFETVNVLKCQHHVCFNDEPKSCLSVKFDDRRDVPVGVPLDLSTPTGMSCIGTYGENCKSDNVSKYLS